MGKNITPLKGIKEFCLQCQGYERKEVKKCDGKMVYELCPLIDFKLGKKSKEKQLPYTPCRAIRKKCLICVGHLNYTQPAPRYRYQYVKECDSPECPLYSFRFGKNPNYKKTEKIIPEKVPEGVV